MHGWLLWALEKGSPILKTFNKSYQQSTHILHVMYDSADADSNVLLYVY